MMACENAVFGIEEVRKAAEKGIGMFPKQIGIPSNSKGCGGIIDIALMIPESVTLFVAPLACCRHVTTHTWQMTDKMYALAVEEPEIVTGQHIETIEKAVMEIYSESTVKPEMINICGSCIDRLMASDFEMVSHDLKNVIDSEINVLWMDPVIGRKEHPQVRCWKKIFSLWDRCDGAPENAVNLIGRLYPPSESSDMRTLLKNAGVEKVRYFNECSTLAEFKSMGRAKLNIVGSKLAVKAAKMLEKEYGIPYVIALPTLDPERVHEVYKEIGEKLGMEIDDAAFLTRTKAEIEAFRMLHGDSGITAAVGESYAGSEDAFSLVPDIAEMGLNVAWIYSDGKIEKKAKEISKAAGSQPLAKVLFISHPASRELLIDPPAVDIAWGMNEKWFSHVGEKGWIDVEKDPIWCDYESISRFMHCVEAKLTDEESF